MGAYWLLTFVMGKIAELHWLAHFLVSRPAQLHAYGNRGSDVEVVVGRALKDNGRLAMDVGLGERALGLPAVKGEETHFDVIWKMEE